MGVNGLPRGTDAHATHDELLLVAYAGFIVVTIVNGGVTVTAP